MWLRADRASTPSTVEMLRTEARKTNVEWIDEVADDVPKRLLEIARTRPETTIALAGTRRAPRWLERPSFPRRLLDAGARELLVLMPPGATPATEDGPSRVSTRPARG